MTFIDYMKNLPNQRIETIREIAKLCEVSDATMNRWMNGKFKPDPLKQKIIAKFLGIPISELFPKNDEE